MELNVGQQLAVEMRFSEKKKAGGKTRLVWLGQQRELKVRF